MKSKITPVGIELIAETAEESFALIFLLQVKSDAVFRSRIKHVLSPDMGDRAYYGMNETDIDIPKYSNDEDRTVV